MTISFRPSGELTAKLSLRDDNGSHNGPGRPPSSSANIVARRDLERYYAVLERELASINLTEREACLVCDANNGLMADPPELACSPTMLWANVSDGIRLLKLDEKWNAPDAYPTGPPVDGPALVAKLQALTPGQTMAVVDAIERFWSDCQNSTVQSVGLVK